MTKAPEQDFLVLTAAPSSNTLTDEKLAVLAEAIPTLPQADRLSDDAVQYAIAPELVGIADAMIDRFGTEAFDINHVSNTARRKKMLIADLESTIIEQECLDELAKHIGKEDVIADITMRAMHGELDFEPALRARVKMLEGLPERALQELYDNGITLMPGAETLLATLRKYDVFCGLVSGGFAFFASRIADKLNFNRFQCNDLNTSNGVLDGTVGTVLDRSTKAETLTAWDDGVLDGTVGTVLDRSTKAETLTAWDDGVLDGTVGTVLGRSTKAETLTAWAKKLSFSEADVLAVGDGSNDMDMLSTADMGVAFRAKPAVAESAPYRIDHGDLTALLYLQGYRQSDFAA